MQSSGGGAHAAQEMGPPVVLVLLVLVLLVLVLVSPLVPLVPLVPEVDVPLDDVPVSMGAGAPRTSDDSWPPHATTSATPISDAPNAMPSLLPIKSSDPNSSVAGR